MTALFVNILKTGISGGIVIMLILFMRLVFRRTPKALICLCWAVAIVRLLLPFRMEASWSLQPSVAVLTDQTESVRIPMASGSVTGEGGEQLLYQQPTSDEESGVGRLQIVSNIWAVGVAVMLGYALVSYLRLRRRVGEAVKISEDVYCCAGLDTAFLLGYFSPRIYVPEMDEQNFRYAYQHEKAHLRRGDHWMMLLGYLAVCLHWFNPLVWISYICLCRDIEGACDERVIRNLGTDERKVYANALLACGKHKSFPVSCPVAFGEVSIKQRVLGVLNYRRPTLVIRIALLLVLTAVGLFFLPDSVERPPYYMVLMDCLDKPLAKVCDRLDIDPEELVQTGAGDYSTPICVQYAGVTMRLFLHTDAKTEDDRLSNFSYVAKFAGDTDEPDRAAAAIAHKLYKAYGPGETAKLSSRPDLFKNISAKEVATALNTQTNTGAAGQVFDLWDISDSGDGNLEEYLKRLQTEYYQDDNNNGGGVKACYLVRFRATYDRDRNVKMITVAYRNYMSFTDWDQDVHFAVKLDPSK